MPSYRGEGAGGWGSSRSTRGSILEHGEQAIVPESWLIAPDKGVGKAVKVQTENLFEEEWLGRGFRNSPSLFPREKGLGDEGWLSPCPYYSKEPNQR